MIDYVASLIHCISEVLMHVAQLRGYVKNYGIMKNYTEIKTIKILITKDFLGFFFFSRSFFSRNLFHTEIW